MSLTSMRGNPKTLKTFRSSKMHMVRVVVVDCPMCTTLKESIGHYQIVIVSELSKIHMHPLPMGCRVYIPTNAAGFFCVTLQIGQFLVICAKSSSNPGHQTRLRARAFMRHADIPIYAQNVTRSKLLVCKWEAPPGYPKGDIPVLQTVVVE